MYSQEEIVTALNIYHQCESQKRIKVSLGNMSPREYRQSLGMV